MDGRTKTTTTRCTTNHGCNTPSTPHTLLQMGIQHHTRPTTITSPTLLLNTHTKPNHPCHHRTHKEHHKHQILQILKQRRTLLTVHLLYHTTLHNTNHTHITPNHLCQDKIPPSPILMIPTPHISHIQDHIANLTAHPHKLLIKM